MMRLPLLLLFVACATQAPDCPQPCPAGPVASLCDVVAQADVNDQHDVVVRTLYQQTPHYGLLFADGCNGVFVAPHFAEDYKESRAVRRAFKRLLAKSSGVPLEIVARGTFHAAGPESFGPSGAPYQLVIHEVLCVNPRPGAQP